MVWLLVLRHVTSEHLRLKQKKDLLLSIGSPSGDVRPKTHPLHDPRNRCISSADILGILNGHAFGTGHNGSLPQSNHET